jgi:hypothetical protein
VEKTTGRSSALKPVVGASVKLEKSAKGTTSLSFASMRTFPTLKVIPSGTPEPPTKRLVVNPELV